MEESWEWKDEGRRRRTPPGQRVERGRNRHRRRAVPLSSRSVWALVDFSVLTSPFSTSFSYSVPFAFGFWFYYSEERILLWGTKQTESVAVVICTGTASFLRRSSRFFGFLGEVSLSCFKMKRLSPGFSNRVKSIRDQDRKSVV